MCVILKGQNKEILTRQFEKTTNINFELFWLDDSNQNYSRFISNFTKCNLLIVEMRHGLQYCHKTYVNTSKQLKDAINSYLNWDYNNANH